MRRIKESYKKYRDIINYLIFGILTVIVNLFTYYICARFLYIDIVESTIIAWLCAVVFAFITNKIWVFANKEWKKNELIEEILLFFLCRVITGVLDLIIMYVFVEKLLYTDMFIKFLSNVIVIILNYFASKLIVFKRK